MAKKKTRTRADIPEGETKAERFVRVVTPRVGKAVKRIQQIGFCAGPTYEYTPEQVEQIIVALAAAVSSIEAKFEQKQDMQTGFVFTG